MIRRASASVALHDSLRERILNLDLAPGQYISRSEIAADYEVSLTPVRDALIKLEEEGLIHIYPQSKTEVSKIDLAHARETHFLRLSLELEIVSRLAAMARKRRCSRPARASRSRSRRMMRMTCPPSSGSTAPSTMRSTKRPEWRRCRR